MSDAPDPNVHWRSVADRGALALRMCSLGLRQLAGEQRPHGLEELLATASVAVADLGDLAFALDPASVDLVEALGPGSAGPAPPVEPAGVLHHRRRPTRPLPPAPPPA